MIRKVFIIGLEEVQNLKYLGLNVDQQDHGSISVSLYDYTQSIQPVQISKVSDKDRLLDSNEYSVYRKLIGQLNWCATQTRVDICFDNCMLGNASAKPKWNDMLYAIKTLRKVKSQDMRLKFSMLNNLNTCKIVCYGDASYANLASGASQGAYIAFIVDESGNANVLSWQSRKLRRVCKDTLTAECLAAVEALHAALFFKAMFDEFIIDNNIKVRLLTDNKSLVQSAKSITSVDDKLLRVDMAILKECLTEQFCEEIAWVPSKDNLANPLTKQGASSSLLIDVLQQNKKFDFDLNIFV